MGLLTRKKKPAAKPAKAKKKKKSAASKPKRKPVCRTKREVKRRRRAGKPCRRPKPKRSATSLPAKALESPPVTGGPTPTAPFSPGPSPAPSAPPPQATPGQAPSSAPRPGPVYRDPPPAAPPPPEPPDGLPAPPTPVVKHFGRADAERLLWRAGLGPRPGEADSFAALGPLTAVGVLTRPRGAAVLTGPEPRDRNGHPIDRENVWGHDHLWWLDRMARTDQPLVERMTLVWHDWFATVHEDVNDQRLLVAQNDTLRRYALGSFEELTAVVTSDPAMLVALNGVENRVGKPNENYARELMELFTLGPDRGAYTETDVRELARALTGWTAGWLPGGRRTDFRFDPARADTGLKRLWSGTPHARQGAFHWRDAVRLCVEHPMHASFFVRKLWGYFVADPPGAAKQAALEKLYVSTGHQIRPVLEAILLSPELYDGPPMVKPPAVHAAGMLRARAQAITTDAWVARCAQAGQQLFRPPSVAGWDHERWLDTSTVLGRWNLAFEALAPEAVHPSSAYDSTETAEEALTRALTFWDRPTLSAEILDRLRAFAAHAVPASTPPYALGTKRAVRQNALRHLVAGNPDANLA